MPPKYKRIALELRTRHRITLSEIARAGLLFFAQKYGIQVSQDEEGSEFILILKCPHCGEQSEHSTINITTCSNTACRRSFRVINKSGTRIRGIARCPCSPGGHHAGFGCPHLAKSIERLLRK